MILNQCIDILQYQYDRENQNFIRLCLFSGVLKPLEILSKILQEDELCFVRAIEAFKKRILEEIQMKSFEYIPIVKKVLT